MSLCNKSAIICAAVLLNLLIMPGNTAEVVEKYPTGEIKTHYNVVNDKKNGKYEELFENGKPKTKAVYKDDQLIGTYQTFHETGGIQINATYRNGKLAGKYTEKGPKGEMLLAAEYVDGKRQGRLVRYINNKPGPKFDYRQDELVAVNGLTTHPRTCAEISQALGQIYQTRFVSTDQPATASTPEFATPERLAAVQRLNAFRYLCNSPADVTLDAEQSYYAQAGSVLLAKIDRLDHKPENPGLPEKEYQDGYKGTSSSNIYSGATDLRSTVDGYLDDSDPKNIERVGHRRWCLSVVMQTTGFGITDRYSALWAFDSRRRAIPDWLMVAYPGKGYFPTEYFRPHIAWSIQLNTAHFQAPTKDCKAKIYPLDENFNPGTPLTLNYENYVSDSLIGNGYAVIFRPEKLDLTPGARYGVELVGVKNSKGIPTPIQYVVEFADIKPAEPTATVQESNKN